MTDTGSSGTDPGIDLGIDGVVQARLLDSGGFADVYEARDEFGRRVAVKVLKALDSDARRRFDRERSVMGMVAGHPHIVNPFTSGYTSTTGRPYVVMEFLGGGSLEQRVRRRGPMQAADAISVVAGIADALAASHQAGIIHKDVKPANILVTEDGTPKLADFGIASIRDVSTTTALAYSPAYSPPETFSADASGDPRDERSDLYSLAATLYFLVTGGDPFLTGGESAATAMVRILNEPSPVTGYPDIDRFLAVAMAKDPAHRYQDASSFADALRTVTGDSPGTSEPTIVAAPPPWPGGAPGPTPPAPSQSGAFAPPAFPPPGTAPAASPAPGYRPSGAPGAPGSAVADHPGGVPPRSYPPIESTGGSGGNRVVWLTAAAVVAAMVLVGAAVVAITRSPGDNATAVTNSDATTDDASTETTDGDDEPSATTETTTGPTSTLGEVGDLAGTTVTIAGIEAGEANLVGIEGALQALRDETGIDVVYTPYELTSDLDVQITGGNPPDIATFAQPIVLADYARSGDLIPMPTDVAAAVSLVWRGEWTELANVDGVQYGVPTKSDPKSLVWYQPARFDELGYTVPRSWDELMALTEQAATDGNIPWCVGIESNSATGWVFTDWVEDVLLRRHGPEVYDRWTTGELRFSEPEVVDSFQEVLDLWSLPGAVHAESGSIVTTGWGDNAVPLVDGDCLMHRQGVFYSALFPPGTPIADGSAEAVDVFYLPSVDENRPLVTAGAWAAAFADRPEVWTVLRYLGSTEYANNRQAAQAAFVGTDGHSGFLSAVNGVDRNLFSALDNSTLDILAIAGPIRYDASDAMPGEIGGGVFWSASTDFVAGRITASEAAAEIDEAWPR